MYSIDIGCKMQEIVEHVRKYVAEQCLLLQEDGSLSILIDDEKTLTTRRDYLRRVWRTYSSFSVSTTNTRYTKSILDSCRLCLPIWRNQRHGEGFLRSVL